MLPVTAVPHKDGPKAAMERLDGILACYLGTHNFHNFTSKSKGKKVQCSTDASALRFITEMSSKEDLITVNGVGFIPIKIDGQSFLFNQIRHMIALAVLIYRSGASNGVFDRVFSSKDPDILFPMVHQQRTYFGLCRAWWHARG